MKKGSRTVLSILFRDVLTGINAVLLIVIFMLLVLINDPSTPETNIESPGNAIVTMTWSADLDDDVDLWLDAPGENYPVYYGNKGGVIWNLLRDDTGYANDVSGSNYENAFTRGLPPGRYVVNVQCFRCSHGDVKVSVDLRLKTASGNVLLVATKTVVLRSNKEEVTAVNFSVNDNGSLIPGSVNQIYHKLVGGRE